MDGKPLRCFASFIFFVFSIIPVGFGDQKTHQVQLETKFVEVSDQQGRELGTNFGELNHANLPDRNLLAIDRIKDPMSNLQSLDSAPFTGFGNDLQLDVIPKIDSKNQDRVQMAVEPKVKILDGQVSSVEAKSAIPVIPPVGSEAKTSVIVQSNSTISIGGLYQNDANSLNHTKPPFLSTIPLIGSLFKNKSESSKKDLMVFVTPHIVNPRDE